MSIADCREHPSVHGPHGGEFGLQHVLPLDGLDRRRAWTLPLAASPTWLRRIARVAGNASALPPSFTVIRR